jgi:chaperone modulatory protein CbpM
MPDEEIILLDSFCSICQIDRSFVETLESHGLISFSYQENQRYIFRDDVVQLEKFSRMYYEMNINVPGIDALNHLLEKIKLLQKETENLKARLKIYE